MCEHHTNLVVSRVQVLKVVLAELDGGVGMRLHLSHSGIAGFIPGKGSICRKRKNTEYSP